MRSSALWCALFFFWASATAWAIEQTAPTSGEPTSSPSGTELRLQNPTQSWEDFDRIFLQLETEATEQSEDSKRLRQQLADSQTEVTGLRSSLADSAKRLSSFEAALEAERAAALSGIQEAARQMAEAERRSKAWRRAAIWSVAGAALGGACGAAASGWTGGGAGAATAAALAAGVAYLVGK